MKLKKKFKIILIILLIITVGVLAFLGYKKFFATPTVKEAKVLNTIKDYDYVLKDNKSKKYQSLFKELAKILEEKEVDYEKYASKLAEMFIVDFYSLDDKTAKTDVGGVDIVHPTVLNNFLENAENTYYKYVESNIYNNRKQSLPEVDTVTIDSVEQTSFTYGETIDEEAYSVKVNWNYTDESFSDYQNEATLIFVHDDKKLYLVELN
jgi:hypothetical protein